MEELSPPLSPPCAHSLSYLSSSSSLIWLFLSLSHAGPNQSATHRSCHHGKKSRTRVLEPARMTLNGYPCMPVCFCMCVCVCVCVCVCACVCIACECPLTSKTAVLLLCLWIKMILILKTWRMGLLCLLRSMSAEMECSHPVTLACLDFQEALWNGRGERKEARGRECCASQSMHTGCVPAICSFVNLW